MNPLRRVTSLTVIAVSISSFLTVSRAGADAPPPRPIRLVVRFAPGTGVEVRREAHDALDAEVVNTLDWRSADIVTVEGASAHDAERRYLRQPGVLSAEPSRRYTTHAAPDDPSFTAEWGLHNTGQEVPGTGRAGAPDVDIDAPEGWASAYGSGRFPASGGVTVGVIDTGVDRGHADLAEKVVACASALGGDGVVSDGSCDDDSGHGTHIAGTIAARTANGVGVAGVAPDASLAVFKALDGKGHGYDADIVAGLRWLRTVAHVDVINMSFGDSARSSFLDDELADAAAHGVLLIASSGNTGDSTPSYPAYHSDVVSVAAVDADGHRPGFSVCNDDVEIAAPGMQVVSTALGGGYARSSGTSMAAAHVSGAAAVLMSRRGLDAWQARSALVQGAGAPAGCADAELLNLQGGMRASAAPRPAPSRPPSPSPSPTPSPLLPTSLPLPVPSSSPSAPPRAAR